MIAENEDKNVDTVFREIKKILNGKSKPRNMYGKYHIAP
jgi:CRISPR/Cas system-associated exonuclease Cas4 (RecB family)